MKLWRWLRCLLFGHAYLLAFGRGRVYVRCAECGDESTGGWSR